MSDDHTIIDHVVILFDNISDDDFYSINANVINKNHTVMKLRRVLVLLGIPNMACVIIRRMSTLITTIIMILQHPVNISLTSYSTMTSEYTMMVVSI